MAPQKSATDWEPEECGMKVLLCSTRALFMSRTTMPDKTFDKLSSFAKLMIEKTEKQKEARRNIGLNPDIWNIFSQVFALAVSIIEQEFFSPAEVNPPGNNAQPTTAMALKDTVLLKDLERLNDLLLIARNVLSFSEAVQNLCGEKGFDQHAMALIDLCVRVTARQYEGEEPGNRTESQLALLNASFKKVLITSLQMLHNFVQHNEKRKLLLWLDLFANSKSADQYFCGNTELRKSPSGLSVGTSELIVSKEILHQKTETDTLDVEKIMKTALDAVQGSTQTVPQLPADEAARIASQVMSTVDGLYNLSLDQRHKSPCGDAGTQELPAIEQTLRENSDSLSPRQAHSRTWTCHLNPRPDLPMYDPSSRSATARLEDLRAVRTPESAAITLQTAKDQLMARLQDSLPSPGDDATAYPNLDDANAADIENSTAGANGSVADDPEDEEGEYHGTGDQERGLLTDIPLVLSPQEIEALPLIIQIGIVTGLEGHDSAIGKHGDMQNVRCNILLAQEAGRNLLRELLIFIAAWDLQDNELYFKVMMQIMEAILQNGLMPFAYQAFGEAKDIVSPAQSMVIKILTQIFRSNQTLPPATTDPPPRVQLKELPGKVDYLIVKYIFTIFRQCIIPETCALIYLQGQIRAGAALPEDFPLNLWDMERVYEGVYQFLEFFAVLTESEDWKAFLVEWKIVNELVTLLRELDASIPKAPLGPLPPTTAETQAEAMELGSPSAQPIPNSVAVERPYDMPAPDSSVPSTAPAPYSLPSSPQPETQEPSDFEWRNLKKLVVLVMSSLVWKSTTVQNQIRQYGGVQMILQCCNLDSNNPYIREHAIMCLRFLLEGNKENQMIVNELEARKTVPDEVLDKRGYETYVDEQGNVGLRAKEGRKVTES
ncbi:MAG: hypothetical protein Q9191_001918 [Dirinaria sp. TL-2023a]